MSAPQTWRKDGVVSASALMTLRKNYEMALNKTKRLEGAIDCRERESRSGAAQVEQDRAN